MPVEHTHTLTRFETATTRVRQHMHSSNAICRLRIASSHRPPRLVKQTAAVLRHLRASRLDSAYQHTSISQCMASASASHMHDTPAVQRREAELPEQLHQRGWIPTRVHQPPAHHISRTTLRVSEWHWRDGWLALSFGTSLNQDPPSQPAKLVPGLAKTLSRTRRHRSRHSATTMLHTRHERTLDI